MGQLTDPDEEIVDHGVTVTMELYGVAVKKETSGTFYRHADMRIWPWWRTRSVQIEAD